MGAGRCPLPGPLTASAELEASPRRIENRGLPRKKNDPPGGAGATGPRISLKNSFPLAEARGKVAAQRPDGGRFSSQCTKNWHNLCAICEEQSLRKPLVLCLFVCYNNIVKYFFTFGGCTCETQTRNPRSCAPLPPPRLLPAGKRRRLPLDSSREKDCTNRRRRRLRSGERAYIRRISHNCQFTDSCIYEMGDCRETNNGLS